MEFETLLIIKGTVISGKIIENKFYMTNLNPTNLVKPPMPEIVFDKKWLDITIKELQTVRAKL